MPKKMKVTYEVIDEDGETVESASFTERYKYGNEKFNDGDLCRNMAAASCLAQLLNAMCAYLGEQDHGLTIDRFLWLVEGDINEQYKAVAEAVKNWDREDEFNRACVVVVLEKAMKEKQYIHYSHVAQSFNFLEQPPRTYGEHRVRGEFQPKRVKSQSG